VHDILLAEGAETESYAIVPAQGARLRVIEADDVRLTDGLHARKTDSRTGDAFRWTNGDARLPSSLFEDWRCDLKVERHVAGATHYVADAVEHRAAQRPKASPRPVARNARRLSLLHQPAGGLH